MGRAPTFNDYAASCYLPKQTINVTASFGVAEQTQDDLSIESIVGLADTALYQAKTMGRNRVNCAEMQPLETEVQAG
ncbi:diguanylate cyclase [uncultured Methylophaga sp.]|uniref:diguanylate cyclase n=1 Tax=uncultured Methylophaga sp. TaxID=285271 RepID=UPI003459AC8B